MTSEIFSFLLDFAVVLGRMAGNLWDLLNEEIAINGVNIPVWGLLGTGALIFTVLLKLIKAIVL